MEMSNGQVRRFSGPILYTYGRGEFRKYAGPIEYTYSNGEIRPYAGLIKLIVRNGEIRPFSGPIIAKFDQGYKYLRPFAGPIEYEIYGRLSEDDLMALVILIYILKEI